MFLKNVHVYTSKYEMPVKILDLKVVHHQNTLFPFNKRSNSKIKIKTVIPKNKWK